MPVYEEFWEHPDKCYSCKRAYTADRVKWYFCWEYKCSKESDKYPCCSECLVKHKFVKKDWIQCHCVKKILAECGELSVEELNSKDSWLWLHKDSVKEEWQLKGQLLLELEFKRQIKQVK